MLDKQNWEQRYVTGDLPWDTGRVDCNLVDALERYDIGPCQVLELGCGRGSNAIWLARRGFDVTALDVSETAVDRARQEAERAGVTVTVAAGDVLSDSLPRGPFGLAFDRGCFHSFDEASTRSLFSRKVSDQLADGGHWLSLIGSTDGPPREVGPPQLSAAYIVAAVEELFEILMLQTTYFDSDLPDPPRASRPPVSTAWSSRRTRRDGPTFRWNHSRLNRSSPKSKPLSGQEDDSLIW